MKELRSHIVKMLDRASEEQLKVIFQFILHLLK